MRAAAEAAATPLTADSDSDSDSGPRGYIHGVRPISGWLKSTARRANWVGCGGSGVPEVSGGIRGSWATLPKSKPFIFGRFEGPRFRFSVFSFRFRLVICWVGVLLIPTILFENFQRNAGNATAKQDSTCRVYRYFN